jgi:integrase
VAELWVKKYEELLTLARLGVIEKIGELTAEVVAGRKKKKEDTSPSLRDFKVKYEDRCRHDIELSDGSIRLNNLALDSFIRAVGDQKLSRLTNEDVVQWKRKLAAEGTSKTTLAIYHRQLRAAFNRAIKWGLVENNPFAVVEIARDRAEDRPTKDMSFEEVRSLLRVIDETGDIPFGNYVKFLAYSGCRRGEIVRLRWEDLDLENWTIRIYAEKTRRSMVIPINKALRRVIERMQIREAGFIFETQSNRGDARRKGQAWSKDFVTHRFKEYTRAAGLPEHYSLHSLRHTYATHLRKKGVPLDIIFRLLGHSSPAVTSAHYDHTIALHFRAQADLIDFEVENL